MKAITIAVVVAAIAAAGNVRAQTVPLPPETAALAVGVERFGLPIVDVALALPAMGAASPKKAWQGVSPLLVARVDPAVLSTGLGLGLQGQTNVVGDGVFVRGVGTVMPTVLARGPVVGGVVTRVQALLGFRLGDIELVTGPRVTPVFTWDTPSEGRIGIEGVVGVRVPMAHLPMPLAITGDIAGGYDVGGHGAGALSGALFVGVQLGAPGA